MLRGKSIRYERRALPLAVAAKGTGGSPAPASVVFQTPPQTASVPPQTGRPKVSIDDPAKPYSIQLVTYKKAEYAEKEMKALKRAGLFSVIIPSGDYYQVCVGQYASSEEAKRDLAFFAAKYKGCYLRRR